MNRLENKVSIVTGAAMGIGKAIAVLFAQEGASVVVADVNPEAGKETADEILADGGKAIFVQCDVANTEQVKRMVESTLEAFGGIDVLINNAGVSIDGTVVDTPESEWDRVLGINLKGIFLCSKYAIPHIAARGGGTVVNVASVAALAGLRRGAAYNASKGGAKMLTKNMALDFAGQGIRVNCLCPGATFTPMHAAGIALADDPEAALAKKTLLRPMGRIGEADESARAALFLACDESSYMTGTEVVVDGGVMAQFPGQVRPGA
jgi:NAD(P)-dependent dehydrogenase (short-subunit alcohol dehydrogenase family)